MSLAMLELGEMGTISEFRGKEETKRHLQDLGFVRGEAVKVVGENKGGLILLIKGAKVALSKGVASMIMVDERKRKAVPDRERT